MIDCFVMASTKLPATLGASGSQYKIRCCTGSVKVGDREFISSTDALEAYLSQYEKQGLFSNQPLYKRTVSDLLDPRSALHMTAERSIETGVRATDTELRLADQKDSINQSLSRIKKDVQLKAKAKKKYLKEQKDRVDEALNKSQELIKHITADDYPKTTDCPSDVGSLNTDILLSINPANPGESLTGLTGGTGFGEGVPDAGTGAPPSWKSKHIYGYKRPRSRRSKTLSSIQIAHDMMGITEDVPNQSFTAQPHERSPHVTFQDEVGKSPSKYEHNDDVSILLEESLNSSRLSRSPGKKARERSRSVSPSILKRERKLFESGLRDKPIPDFYTDFNTTPPGLKAPSWVDTMNISDVSDNDCKKRDFTVSKPPPSWINDIDNSDITSVISAPPKSAKTLAYEDLLRPLPVINNNNTQNSSYNSDVNENLPAPGLTYKDLVDSPLKGGKSKSNTQSKAPGPRDGSPTLSDKLNDIRSKTTATLQRYHQRMQSDINLDSPSKGSGPYSGEGVPRCSSLDTEALLAGIAPPGKADITGASPIRIGDSDSMVTDRGSPGKQVRPRSPDTDIILEGDRPWEKTATFKAPVTVDGSRGDGQDNQENYSGGSQPGSLEALKNMIFKLQQEAIHTDSEDEGSRSKLSERVYKLRAEAASLGIPVSKEGGKGDGKGTPGDIPALHGYDFHGEPGGESLEKALVHLDRLKNLVHTQDGAKPGTAGVTPLCANMADGN